jgi:hypothetical protein
MWQFPDRIIRPGHREDLNLWSQIHEHLQPCLVTLEAPMHRKRENEVSRPLGTGLVLNDTREVEIIWMGPPPAAVVKTLHIAAVCYRTTVKAAGQRTANKLDDFIVVCTENVRSRSKLVFRADNISD